MARCECEAAWSRQYLPEKRVATTLDESLTWEYREALYEDESFPERSLAALVASKIYYHLQEYDESMVFALGAGKLFDIEREGEFEDTIIGMLDLKRCAK